MTREELEQNYSRWSREDLIEELIRRDLKTIQPQTFEKYIEKYTGGCRNWQDCTNPFRDCVNCPLRWYTSFSSSGSNFTETLSNNALDEFTTDCNEF